MTERPEDWGDDWTERQERLRAVFFWLPDKIISQPIRAGIGRVYNGFFETLTDTLTDGLRVLLLSVIGIIRFVGIPMLAILVISVVVWRIDKRLDAVEVALGGRGALGCDMRETTTNIGESLVRIIGQWGEGTGFPVADDYILTNEHVISNEPNPKIVFSDGSFVTGVVVEADEDYDLALVYAPSLLEPLEWVPWGVTHVGQQVIALGYALGGQLGGPATANLTSISAIRDSDDRKRTLIQTQGGTTSGMSGGPMVNLCGQVIAVTTASGQSLGIGLSTDDAHNWTYRSLLGGPTMPAYEYDVEALDPDESPEALVQVYYNYVAARNFPAAFALLSDNFIGDVTYEEWVAGFDTSLQTTIFSAEQDPANRWRVGVYIASTDLEDGVFIYRYFSGTWLVRKEADGHLRLWESNIKEMTDED